MSYRKPEGKKNQNSSLTRVFSSAQYYGKKWEWWYETELPTCSFCKVETVFKQCDKENKFKQPF